MKLQLTMIVLCLLVGGPLLAQHVGVGTQAPHSSAQLDVFADNRGLLVPRVSLSNALQAAPVSSPAVGLLVWNTNAAVSSGQGVGFYYWAGNHWKKLAGSTEGWMLSGNSGVDTSRHFIGTTGTHPSQTLRFKVAGQWAGSIEATNENLYFGTRAGGKTLLGNGFDFPERNTFIGFDAGRENVRGTSSTYVGAAAGRSSVAGFGNTMVGAYAGAAADSSEKNTYIGFGAGGGIGKGHNGVIIGFSAGSFQSPATEGQTLGNVVIGYEAGQNLKQSIGNVTLGRAVAKGNLSSSIGLGNYNVFIGDSSGISARGLERNVAIGRRSGLQLNTGNGNVLIGDSAGHNLTSGQSNVIIGEAARAGSATLQNATAIGSKAVVGASHALILGSIAGVNGATNSVNVGIGTTTPAFRLHVVTNDAQNFGFREGIVVENTATGTDGQGNANTGEAAISFKNAGPAGTGTNQWMVGLNQNRNLAFAYGPDFAGTPVTKVVIDSTGRVGIGTASPNFQLQLSLNSAAKPGSNTWTVSSDERLKKDMHPFEDGLEVLRQIDPIWFTYTGAENHPQEQFVGTTAQALKKVAPYMVTTLKEKSEVGDKLLGVDYGPMQFILINAIKEQQKMLEAQQQKIDLLEKMLEQQGGKKKRRGL